MSGRKSKLSHTIVSNWQYSASAAYRSGQHRWVSDALPLDSMLFCGVNPAL